MGGQENFPLGFALCIIAGACNSSWQIPVKTNNRIPKWLRIVNSEGTGWHFEHAWLTYTAWSIVIAIAVPFSVLGHTNIDQVYSNVSGYLVFIVCLFGFLWGVGSIGFGLAVQILGIGIGTGLCMGVIIVLGTLLPLLYHHLDDSDTVAYGLTIVGTAVGVVGFAVSAKAGSYNSTVQDRLDPEQIECVEIELSPASQKDEDLVEVKEEQEPKDNKTFSGVIVAIFGGIFASQLQFSFVFGQPLIDEAQEQGLTEFWSTQMIWLLAFTMGGLVSIAYTIYNISEKRTWTQFVDCTSNQVSAKKKMINKTEMLYDADVDKDDSMASKAIDGSSISMENAINGHSSNENINMISNDNSTENGDHDLYLMLIKNMLLTLGMAVVWMAHIVIYGYSQSLMGELGAGIAWPLIMIITVAGGQIWSYLLGEWVDFHPTALFLNKLSLIVQFIAVVIIALGNSL